MFRQIKLDSNDAKKQEKLQKIRDSQSILHKECKKIINEIKERNNVVSVLYNKLDKLTETSEELENQIDHNFLESPIIAFNKIIAWVNSCLKKVDPTNKPIGAIIFVNDGDSIDKDIIKKIISEINNTNSDIKHRFKMEVIKSPMVTIEYIMTDDQLDEVHSLEVLTTIEDIEYQLTGSNKYVNMYLLDNKIKWLEQIYKHPFDGPSPKQINGIIQGTYTVPLIDTRYDELVRIILE